MSLYETKYCPQCKEKFDCNPDNIAQCQCYGVKLTDKQKIFIKLHYKDCLCNNCLSTLQNDIELFKEKYIYR